MKTVIEVDKLKFDYNGVPVLDGIHFSLFERDCAALIGGNGAGKSTLMKLLLNQLPCKDGEIKLLGEPIAKFKRWSEIGYVPQNCVSRMEKFPATALEVVLANLYSRIGLFRFPNRQHRELAMNALKLVDMQDSANRLVRELSGGQQQRIMIARVLAAEPRLLLLDEPTNGIDSQSMDSFFMLLERLNQSEGMTTLIVTHDENRASDVFHRIFCLENGSLVELNPCQLREELNHKHKHPERTAVSP